MPTAIERLVSVPEGFDLRRTLAPLRHGPWNPSVRFETDEVWRACRTPHGAATLHVSQGRQGISARAWGEGAEWILEATPGLLGHHDKPETFRPSHPVIAKLHRQFTGLRICRTSAVVETLVPTILKQKVTSLEAARSYRALLLATGEPAPGPADLLQPPSAQRLAALPYWRFHPMGIERKRAEIVRRVCAEGRRLESLTRVPSPEGQGRLQAIPGVGRWTASEVARVAWGTPMRCAWVISICPAWCRGGSLESAGQTTPACSSCWSRTGATGDAPCVCFSWAVATRPGAPPECRPDP